MRKKPLLFTIVPLILIGVCASFYFQTAYVLNAEYTDYQRILSKITTSNWITMLSMIITGVAILRSSKWSKLLMPLTIGIVFWNNYLVATHTNNFTSTQIILAALLFAIVFVPLYNKKIQMVLSDRRHQWWKTAFRKKENLLVTVIPQNGTPFSTETIDLSITGIFLKAEDREWSSLPQIGDSVQLNIDIKNKEIKCMAKVARHTEATSYSPRGIGLEFFDFHGTGKKDFKELLKKPSAKV